MNRPLNVCLHLVFTLLIIAYTALPFAQAAEQRPLVRTVTAFIHLQRSGYQEQVFDALTTLRKVKARLQQANYPVQTLRISTQPFPQYTHDLSPEQALTFFQAFDKLAKQESFMVAIGPALQIESKDTYWPDLLADILLNTQSLNSTLIIGGKEGVYWHNVRAAAKLIKRLSTPPADGLANFKFAAAAHMPANSPFYPASFQQGSAKQFAIGLQSANVVAEAFASSKDPNTAGKNLSAALGEHALTIEAIANKVANESDWRYVGMDLSPAPMGNISIGRALENLSGVKVGTVGTLSAAAILTKALRDIPVKKAGYSGLMIPVLEDEILAKRWSEGTLTLNALLSYSSVCAAGLDTIPLPADVSVQQLERIIGDVASLSVKYSKALAVRLMPVPGKKAGDYTRFNDPFIVNARLQAIH